MASPHPRLFTVPASVPFLPTLVSKLVEGAIVPGVGGDDPLALAAGAIYLPTRRACRLARDCFLSTLGTEAAILPRLIPLGDVDADELAFAEAAQDSAIGIAMDFPLPATGAQRRLMLTQLVTQWAERERADNPDGTTLPVQSPGAALALADALARLIDDMTTRKVPWEQLDELVADELDEYWQLTLKVLKIARDEWPPLRDQQQFSEPAGYRDLMIAAEAERLRRGGESFVIGAGSTASMPSTAALLGTIAALPHGAVVLPGLDTDLDEASWELLGSAKSTSPTTVHPQYSMHRFLRDLAVARTEVTNLAAAGADGRERLLSEALRPAASTDQWKERPLGDLGAQAATIAMIEAGNPEEEALAVAIALREPLEDAERRVALVTPDRSLARRVAAALGRWNIPVDDSGGDPLSATRAGVFARLAAEAAAQALPPVTLLGMLKHPLLRLGKAAGEFEAGISILERAVLRGPRPSPGSAGLVKAIEALRAEQDQLHEHDAHRRLTDRQFEAVEKLVGTFAACFAPLEAVAGGAHPLADIAAAHHAALTALSEDQDEIIQVFAGDDGLALEETFEELINASATRSLRIDLSDYPEMFTALLSDRIVRRGEVRNARVSILGLLEARLQTFDRVVLGGLVEGVWPPQVRTDPWLSRPMREQLGLDLPERRIGLTAHDFAQALGAPDVVLSRAAKIGGAPTVASRFVQRLAAVAGEAAWGEALKRGAIYVRWARKLDEPLAPSAAPRPAPTPPLSARPQRLSVTEIEHLLRDPYTIYAKHVLKLRPLDPVDCPPGAGDRGSAIHAALSDFTRLYPDNLPPNALEELERIGRTHFEPLAAFPEAQAFWWPRFMRAARWFIPWEAERRANAAEIHSELKGELSLAGLNQDFKLTVRADRVERLKDGSYAVLDYKTGRAPTTPQVLSGLAPQLTLEGAILRHGKLGELPNGVSVSEISYVRLHGGEPPGEVSKVDTKDSSPDLEADKAREELTEVIRRFGEARQPYLSMVRPMWRKSYGEYDHLARVREWSLTGGVAEEAAEP